MVRPSNTAKHTKDTRYDIDSEWKSSRPGNQYGSGDGFDWTEGWNGNGQFMVAYQEAEESLGYDCDCLMECDNNGDNFAATPVAHPTLANLTLI